MGKFRLFAVFLVAVSALAACAATPSVPVNDGRTYIVVGGGTGHGPPQVEDVGNGAMRQESAASADAKADATVTPAAGLRPGVTPVARPAGAKPSDPLPPPEVK